MLPTYTTNITGLRNCTRGSSLRNESRSPQDSAEQNGAVRTRAHSWFSLLPIICRCSTTGPSASAGTNVSAPTSSTMPTSIVMNRGVCVGRVPAVIAVARLAARLPAIASTGMISQYRDIHIAAPSIML